MSSYLLETQAGIEWPKKVHPEQWRDEPDPDGDDDAIEDDIDHETPQYVIDVLGFDPDELS